MLDIFQEIRMLKEKISSLTSNSIGNNTLNGYLQTTDDTITKQGNTFNGNSQLIKTDTNGKLPAVDGSALINLPFYEAIVVSTYANAVIQAIGTKKKIITVTTDETDNGNKNRYYYEGVNGELDLQF